VVQFSIILVFLAFHLHDYGVQLGEPVPGGPCVVALWTLAPLAVLALILGLSCRRAARLMDHRGDLAAYARAERIARVSGVLATLHTLIAVLSFGWLGAIRESVGDLVVVDECLAITPLLALFAAGSWTMHPLEMRLREAALFRNLHDGTPIHRPPTRLQHVWLSFRHGALIALVPIALISAWHELVILGVAKHWIPEAWLRQDASAPYVVEAIKLSGTIAVFVVTPFLLRHVWDTVPIESGPFRDMLESMCRRHRVRLRTPLLWRTHGAIVNGAVLGLVWPFRYMLFTDALLERLSAREVEAVAAHEVGHVRRRHILWTILSVLAALLLVELAVASVPTPRALADDSILALVSSVVSLAAVVGVFGFVSRRFEWQADAFAVQDLSLSTPPELRENTGHENAGHARTGVVTREAVLAMSSALRAVASINGINPERFAFRHGSIESRVRRLSALAGLPLDRLPIDRRVVLIKIVAAAGLAAAVALLLFRYVLDAGARA
jgi:Zn-dependent protease with chaperone function